MCCIIILGKTRILSKIHQLYLQDDQQLAQLARWLARFVLMLIADVLATLLRLATAMGAAAGGTHAEFQPTAGRRNSAVGTFDACARRPRGHQFFFSVVGSACLEIKSIASLRSAGGGAEPITSVFFVMLFRYHGVPSVQSGTLRLILNNQCI